jgi:hypothetical protein
LNGHLEGVTFISIPNWTGIAISFPRSRLLELCHEPELSRSGVYILVGSINDSTFDEQCYIGQATSLNERLSDHQKSKDWWDRCLVVTTADSSLQLTERQYLESVLIEKARAAGIVQLDNKQCPSPPVLGRADACDVGNFLDNVLLVADVARYSYFKPVDKAPSAGEVGMATPDPWLFDDVELTYRGSVVDGAAHGRYLPTLEFQVREGSKATLMEVPSVPKKTKAIRARLIESGVVMDDGEYFVFTTDHVFDSPSSAACFVYGGSLNGRSVWKNSRNQSIIEIEAQANRDSGNRGLNSDVPQEIC